MDQIQSTRRLGFTLLELLAVIATIVTLAALLLPVLANAKTKAQRAACASNLRQLDLAWQMYYEDNDDYLPQSYASNNTNAWVLGDMSNPAQATNADLIREGSLYRYADPGGNGVSLYHCPADPGVTIGGTNYASVRSYSMNGFMGGRDPSIGPIPWTAGNYVSFFAKYSDLSRAHPSQLWVLLDEDERSIDDGSFVTDPNGQVWFDFPAISKRRHDFSYGLCFADGHSEIWQITDPRSKLVTHGMVEQSGNTDLERLAAASTTPK
jgi:type II secretory pathway pseudopilin PulG